jgi:AraC-like DNA-binding protein
MASPSDEGADIAPLRFSTDALPERDRLAIWREVIGRTIAKLDLSPLSDGPFRSESVSRILPGVAVTSISMTSVRSERTRELIADGNDDVVLVWTNEGGPVASQLGREILPGPFTAILLSNAEVSSFVVPAKVGGMSLRIPHALLAPLVPNLEDAFMRPIPPGNEALQLLAHYVAPLTDGQRLSSPELRQAVATHICDLVALVIGTNRDTAMLAESRGGSAARLRAIKADVVKNLTTHGLDVATVAARHKLTPRHLHRLFEAQGTTFSEFVLHQRLGRAHRMLADPRYAQWSIAAIADECGFADRSHFNRAIRASFGAAPSDLRAAAKRDRKE